MAAPDLQHLSKRERQIMNILFKDQPLSAQAIMEKMEDAPGYATVRKLLGILEQKGHVYHTKSGRQFIYQATISDRKVKKSSLHQVLDTFFKGSITEAVATLLNEKDTRISEQELAELEALIQEAKKKQNQ